MARPIQWTEVAVDDLEHVADYIARDSTHYAAAFIAEIRDAARSLADFAERGRIVPELHEPVVRELIVDNYRLVYEIGRDTIFVLGIIHGARDLERLWNLQERRRPSGDDAPSAT